MAYGILNTDQELRNIVSQIVRIANPDKIILFGSRATGKAKEGSDYDLCVIKRSIKKKSSFLGKIYLKLNSNLPVDVIAVTNEKFEEMKNKWCYVYYYVNKEGKVIYERGNS